MVVMCHVRAGNWSSDPLEEQLMMLLPAVHNRGREPQGCSFPESSPMLGEVFSDIAA